MNPDEVLPKTVQMRNGRWQLNHTKAHPGGGLFAVTAEWCPHCVQLKNQVVPKAKELNSFNFFWMDGDKTEDARTKSQQLNIEGFPTLYRIERDGYLTEYNGDRSPSGLAQSFHR